MWPVTLATATAGEMPRNINSGVMRKPPPMPNMPEMKPTASPIAENQEDVDRQVCDREIDLARRAVLGSRLICRRAARSWCLRKKLGDSRPYRGASR